MGFISGLSSSYLQSILGNVLTGKNGASTKSSSASSAATADSPVDSQQLSPFAQLLSTLQQLQQSSPTQYQQVTQQISTNLQNAAQTAKADGNSTGGSQLNQLASDFSSASQSGQLPDMQDLAQAMSGGRHRHHTEPASTDLSGSASNSSNTNAPLSQLLAALQDNGSQGDSTNPMSIILNTLSAAGVSGS